MSLSILSGYSWTDIFNGKTLSILKIARNPAPLEVIQTIHDNWVKIEEDLKKYPHNLPMSYCVAGELFIRNNRELPPGLCEKAMESIPSLIDVRDLSRHPVFTNLLSKLNSYQLAQKLETGLDLKSNAKNSKI